MVSAGLALCRLLLCAATLMAGPLAAPAQVTITSADMFNQPGQYYYAYCNNSSNTVQVSSMLGTTGGPQTWDFSAGPQDVTYRFDYVTADKTPYGDDFVAVGAQIAEQKTDEADPSVESWLYFTQDPVKGRLDYGFYDPTFSSAQPESVFTNALQDFPNAIHYGDSWPGSTVFSSVYSFAGYGDFPDQLTYTLTGTVDAYGTIKLPNIGSVECLRVHEMVEYDVGIDLGLGEGYMSAGTQVRAQLLLAGAQLRHRRPDHLHVAVRTAPNRRTTCLGVQPPCCACSRPTIRGPPRTRRPRPRSRVSRSLWPNP